MIQAYIRGVLLQTPHNDHSRHNPPLRTVSVAFLIVDRGHLRNLYIPQGTLSAPFLIVDRSYLRSVGLHKLRHDVRCVWDVAQKTSLSCENNVPIDSMGI